MTSSKTPFFRFFGPLLCSLVSGCGSDTPEDPLKSANGFCGEWGKNVCVQAIVSDCEASSVEDCQEAQREFCLDRVTEALYTGRGAAECLSYIHEVYRDEALKPAERNALVSLTEPCDKLLSGSGDKGDACNEDKDCATVDDLVCVKRIGETRGQCHEPEEVQGGGRCGDADAVCEGDFYCNGTHCVAKTPEDEPCSESIPCDETTYCVIEDDADEGICVAKKDVGDACLSDEQCDSELCDRNANEDEGLCVRSLKLNHRLDMCKSFR